MSYSGTYGFRAGKLVRLSAQVPDVTDLFRVSVPGGGYTSEHMGHQPVEVRSRRHKIRLLRERGLREAPSQLSRKEI
jgi:hypothetical protein